MGFKCVVLALALVGCLAVSANALGPKNEIVEPPFPGDDMSGAEIYQEIEEGVYANAGDASLSFRNQSLFIVREDTGMSPHVPGEDVRTPVKIVRGLGPAPAAGSWSFVLRDTATKYLRLNVFQTGDAVFGYGDLKDNDISSKVTVGGTQWGDRLALYVTPEGSQNLYRLDLVINRGSMSGDYLYTYPGRIQPGVAFGSLVSPVVAVPQTQQASQAQG